MLSVWHATTYTLYRTPHLTSLPTVTFTFNPTHKRLLKGEESFTCDSRPFLSSSPGPVLVSAPYHINQGPTHILSPFVVLYPSSRCEPAQCYGCFQRRFPHASGARSSELRTRRLQPFLRR